MLEAKTEDTSNGSLLPDEESKANNRNNPALYKNGSITRQGQADTWWLGLLKGDSQPSMLKSIQLLFVNKYNLIIIHMMNLY